MSSLWTMSLRWNWLVSGNDSRERERGSGAMGAQTPPPPGISDIYSFQGFIGPAPYFQGFIWPIFQGFTFIGPNLFWALPPHLPGKNIFLTPPPGQSLVYAPAHGREGFPGRHKPPPCRHEPPRFARQTEPPPCSKRFRYGRLVSE